MQIVLSPEFLKLMDSF